MVLHEIMILVHARSAPCTLGTEPTWPSVADSRDALACVPLPYRVCVCGGGAPQLLTVSTWLPGAALLTWAHCRPEGAVALTTGPYPATFDRGRMGVAVRAPGPPPLRALPVPPHAPHLAPATRVSHLISLILSFEQAPAPSFPKMSP